MFVFINESSGNDTSVKILSGVDYLAYNAAFLGFLLIPVFLLNIFLIALLFCKVVVSWIIRFSLFNNLASCVMLSLGLIMHRLAGITLVLLGEEMELNMEACGFILWLIVSGSMARMIFLALYAITVFAVVKGRPSFLRGIPGSMAVAVSCWLVCLISSALYINLPMTNIDYTVGLSCTLYSVSSAAYAFEAAILLFLGVIPFVVACVVPIITLLHIRRKTRSRDTDFQNAIAKFAIFLIIGNFFNLVAIFFPMVTFAMATSPAFYSMNVVSVYIPYAVLSFSLLPTPILVLVYFRNLRTKIKSLFCIKSGRDTEPNAMHWK